MWVIWEDLEEEKKGRRREQRKGKKGKIIKLYDRSLDAQRKVTRMKLES